MGRVAQHFAKGLVDIDLPRRKRYGLAGIGRFEKITVARFARRKRHGRVFTAGTTHQERPEANGRDWVNQHHGQTDLSEYMQGCFPRKPQHHGQHDEMHDDAKSIEFNGGDVLQPSPSVTTPENANQPRGDNHRNAHPNPRTAQPQPVRGRDQYGDERRNRTQEKTGDREEDGTRIEDDSALKTE